MSPAQRIPLAHPGNAERLAWETPDKDIVICNVFCREWDDIADELVIIAEVLDIGLF
jgi:hypothetical protein